MNPSPSDPQPLPGSQPVPREKDADLPSQRELLEEILARTDRIIMQPEPVADAKPELEALRRIVRLHRGESQLSEPVLSEWVAAMLHDHFAAWIGSDAMFLAVAAQIAKTLAEDPSASRRLQGLWCQLTEEPSGEGNA
jgi:hypothetical protein